MSFSTWSVVAGETPTAAKWNILGSNDQSFNDGTGIGTNAVTAASLSTTAITLGVAVSTTNFSTSSTTAVQVTGLTKVVTIPGGGRNVEVSAFMSSPYNDTNNSGYELTIWDGTVGSGTQIAMGVQERVTPVSAHVIMAMAVITPSAGSKTYNVGIRAVTSGIVNTQSSATTPSCLLVKAI